MLVLIKFFQVTWDDSYLTNFHNPNVFIAYTKFFCTTFKTHYSVFVSFVTQHNRTPSRQSTYGASFLLRNLFYTPSHVIDIMLVSQ